MVSKGNAASPEFQGDFPARARPGYDVVSRFRNLVHREMRRHQNTPREIRLSKSRIDHLAPRFEVRLTRLTSGCKPCKQEKWAR